MNIIVKPYGSTLCCCRPDTTWERENRDFYSPECVNEVTWTPVVFARISKAGKCIGRKFAERYFDGFGCGMLMYCKVGEDLCSCVDRTSILPMPLYNPVVLENNEDFVVTKNGEPITTERHSSVISTERHSSVISTEWHSSVISTERHSSVISTERSEWRNLLCEALCSASLLTSLRIGDYVAVELAPQEILATREEGTVSVKGTFCENDIFDFKMIF